MIKLLSTLQFSFTRIFFAKFFRVTKKKCAFAFLFFCLLAFEKSFAGTTITSTTSGTSDWSLGSTWVGGIAPGSTDTAIIASGKTVTVTTTISVVNITINGILTVSAGSLTTTTGGITVIKTGVAPHLNVSGGTVSVATTIDIQAVAVYNQTGGTVTVATVANSSSSPSFYGETGSGVGIASPGILIIQNPSAYTPSSAAMDYNVVPGLTGSTGTLQIASGSTTPASLDTFRITGSMPNLSLNSTTNPIGIITATSTATSVVLSGSAKLSLGAGGLTVANGIALNSASTYTDAGSGSTGVTAGGITLNGTSTYNQGNGTVITAGGITLNNSSTYYANSNLIVTAGDVTLNTSSTFTLSGTFVETITAGNIVLNGAGTTYNLTGGGDLLMSNNSSTINGTGTFNCNGYARFGSVITNNTTYNGTSPGSFNVYNGSATTSYGNLTLEGTGIYTQTEALAVNGTLTINGPTTYTQAYTLTAGAGLILNSATITVLSGYTQIISAGGISLTGTSKDSLASGAALQVTGNITSNSTSTIALNGTAVTLNSCTINNTGPINMYGTVSVSGDLLLAGTGPVNQGGTVVLSGSFAVTGGSTYSKSSGGYFNLLGANASDPGNFTVSGGSSFTDVAGSGNGLFFSNNYTGAQYNGTGGTVTLKFVGIQTSPNTNTITLNSPMTIRNGLVLSTGVLITTDANLLTVGSTAAASTVSAITNSNSYINGPMARVFLASRSASSTTGTGATTSTIFPIAINNQVMPVYIDPTITAAGAVTIQLDIVANNGAAAWLTPNIYTNYQKLNRDWKITVSGTGAIAAGSYVYANAGVTGGFIAPTTTPIAGSEFFLVSNPGASGTYNDGTATAMGYVANRAWGSYSLNPATTGSPLVSGSYFSVASYAPPTAAAVPGVNGATTWYEANAGTSTNTTGAAVNSWTDQSGSGNTATQTSAPIFQDGSTTSAINFNPAVSFSSPNSMTLANDGNKMGLGYLNPFATYIVSKSASTPASNGNIGKFMATGSNGLYEFDMAPTGLIYTFSSSPIFATDATVTNDGHAYIQSYRRGYSITNPSNWYANVNGNTTAANNSNSIGTNFSQADAIYKLGNGTYTGSVAEIIYVPFDPTYNGSTSQQQIESYLGLKYGVSLDQTLAQNYLASDGSTVMWNAAAVGASSHNQNIFGIGRDDASALAQVVSTAQTAGSILTVSTNSDFTSANSAGTRVAISSNKQFMMISDDGGSTSSTTAANINTSIYASRVTRTWLVQNSLTQQVYLQFTGFNSSSSLIYTTNSTTDFTSNTTSLGVLSSTGIIGPVTMPANAIFTLVTPIAPGGVNGSTLWVKGDISGLSASSWPNIGSTTATISGVGTPVVNSGASAGALNYIPTVSFSSGNYYTTNNDFGISASNLFTIFSVVTPAALSGYQAIIGGNVSATGQFMFGFNGTPSMIDLNAAGLTQSGSFINSINTPYIMSVNRNPSNTWIFMRNGQTDAATGTNGGAMLTQNMQLGAARGNAIPFSGTMAELISFNSSLTATQTQKVNSYLALKYGITLNNSAGGTAGDYTLSNGTNVWTASANPIYHNQVIGIVRDNTSGLLQKQAHTANDSLRLFVGGAVIGASNSANTGTITNDLSSVFIGNNGGGLGAVPQTLPTGITSMFGRYWKITNTNFTDNFAVEIKWANVGNVNISDLRLLVSSSPDLSNPAIYDNSQVTFSIGSIIVSGLNPSVIPFGTSYFTIGSASLLTPLPVNITAFNAVAVNNSSVDVIWQTSSEINSNYFTVQRSADGAKWDNVTKVVTAGNSSSPENYNAIDENPLNGVSYYRVEQTDLDGKSTATGTKAVKIDNTNNNALIVYPNPATSLLTIKGDIGELKLIKIYNTSGQDVSSLVKTIENNSTVIELDISKLPAGTYSIKTKTSITKISRQ